MAVWARQKVSLIKTMSNAVQEKSLESLLKETHPNTHKTDIENDPTYATYRKNFDAFVESAECAGKHILNILKQKS
jgi:hypothetical protein